MFDESLLVEQETSRLLSVELFGVPTFEEEGPAVTINGDVAGLGVDPLFNPVVGAIEAIAAHPTDANTIFIGAVAGGIWRTTDGGNNWTPLTDEWLSLSIGALAISPLDATNNTLFAGTGNFSSDSSNGGPAVGALRSTDGGDTWDFIGGEFFGERVRSIVPTAIGNSLADQVVLVATVNEQGSQDEGGVYRSSEGGNTFALISGTSGASDGLDNNADGTVDEDGELNLPIGNASHLVQDPGDENSFYAALPKQGIFRSDNGGLNWIKVNTGLTGVEDATRIELSVSEATGNPVYAALIQNVELANVFRSDDQGATWTQVGEPPEVHPPSEEAEEEGGQADLHFSILADNAAPNIVYVGGTTVKGGTVGNIFRGDSTTGTWTSIVLSGAAGTAPHADSREMIFDANNNILQADDGGIYRLINPNADGTQWESLPSMPRVAQFYRNISYDELNHVIVGGTQDTGTIGQIDGFIWRDFTKADGGVTAIDNDQNAHPGTIVYYASTQELGFFQRITFDNNHTQIGEPDLVKLVVEGAGSKTLTASVDDRYTFDMTIQFVQPYVLNRIDPERMLIGTSFLYESTDRGDTLTSLGGLNNLNANTLDDDLDGATDEGDEFTPDTPIGRVTKMVYGGRAGGLDNPDLIYVASVDPDTGGPALRVRTDANEPHTLDDFSIFNLDEYQGSLIKDVEIDPDDWHRGYVLDDQGRVFRFENVRFENGDAIADWTDITGNLSSLVKDVRAVELFTPTSAAGDDFLLVSGFGGVYRTLNPGPSAAWTSFGVWPNLVATDVVYIEADDVLIVGTYGRGAWTLANASTMLAVPSGLQITGDADFAGQDDVIKLQRNAADPRLLDVFLNSSVPTRTVQLSTLQQINVDGLGGNDTLIVDSSNGLINVPLGIRYDGGGGVDELHLEQTGGRTRASDTYSLGAEEGSGVSTIVGTEADGTQTVFFEDLSPVLDLVPAASLTVNGTASTNAISYAVGSDGTKGLVTIDDHEPIEFANKAALTINAGGGQDTISVNNASTPTGLAAITINGGDPSLGDVLSVTGVGTAVFLNTATFTITGATGEAGSVLIAYSTIEALALLAGIGDLTLTTTVADDTLIVTPALVGGSNSGTVQSNGAMPQIVFLNSGTLTADLDGGANALVVNGSSSADIVAVSGASVAIIGRYGISYTGVEGLTVNGQAGSDTFNVTASATVAIFIDGGDPVGTPAGDRLNILTGDNSVFHSAGPQVGQGSVVVGANQPVSFDHIETFGGPTALLPPAPGVALFASDGSAVTLAVPPS